MNRELKTETDPNFLLAINRMNIPRRRVDKNDIGDDDVAAGHELDQVTSRVTELFPVELIPPDLALSIDASIVP